MTIITNSVGCNAREDRDKSVIVMQEYKHGQKDKGKKIKVYNKLKSKDHCASTFSNICFLKIKGEINWW